jgi:hypothetical protein
MPKNVNDQVILKELHEVPEERWSEVLTFIRSLKQQPPTTDCPVLSGADLAGSDLIGIWSTRSDIPDSQEYARQLRHQAEHRRSTDAVGH